MDNAECEDDMGTETNLFHQFHHNGKNFTLMWSGVTAVTFMHAHIKSHIAKNHKKYLQ